MLTAHDVADFFLSPSTEEDREQITNLKLQKLLYYAQGYSLAILGTPIFDDYIENWQHGPVVPTVYQTYKKYGAQWLPPSFPELDKFSESELFILNKVRREKGCYTAWFLRDQTHQEYPWLNTTQGEVIPIEMIKEHFVNVLPKETFNYDLDKTKAILQEEFHTIPASALTDTEELEKWITQTF